MGGFELGASTKRRRSASCWSPCGARCACRPLGASAGRSRAAVPRHLLAAGDRADRPPRTRPAGGLAAGVRARRARRVVGLLAHPPARADLRRGATTTVDPLVPEPRVVVDLGSNIGLSILFFRLRFPDAEIYGVEPDPTAFDLLQRNVGGLGGVTVRQAAVGDHGGAATFWSAPGAVASSLFQTHDAQQPVEVPVRDVRAAARRLRRRPHRRAQARRRGLGVRGAALGRPRRASTRSPARSSWPRTGSAQRPRSGRCWRTSTSS